MTKVMDFAQDGVYNESVAASKEEGGTYASVIEKKLSENKICVGTLMQFSSPELVELFGYSGMDFVTIDMEHGAIDYSQLKDMMRAAEAVDLATVVRIPYIAEDPIKKTLDLGASCLLVPNVETPEQVRELVRHSLYAPLGTRGSCPFVRQHKYGLADNVSCYTDGNSDLVLWLTLESPASIDRGNMRAIMDVGGFDLISIGAWDMAVSLGVPGQVTHPKIIEAREYLEQLNSEYGTYTGIHVEDAADLSILKERPSARMIHLSVINGMMLKTSDSVLNIKTILGKNACR